MAFMHVHRPGDSHSHANLAAGFLSAALVATLVLVVAEFVGGYLGHSIALVSDAVHNLSDVPAILISWIAARWTGRPADTERPFGYLRACISAACTTSSRLLVPTLAVFWRDFDSFWSC